MNVVSIEVKDQASPFELQSWFDANPTVTIHTILSDGRTFFIFYQ